MFDDGFLQRAHVSWAVALQPVQHLGHRPLGHSLGRVHHPESKSETLCKEQSRRRHQKMLQHLNRASLMAPLGRALLCCVVLRCVMWGWTISRSCKVRRKLSQDERQHEKYIFQNYYSSALYTNFRHLFFSLQGKSKKKVTVQTNVSVLNFLILINS